MLVDPMVGKSFEIGGTIFSRLNQLFIWFDFFGFLRNFTLKFTREIALFGVFTQIYWLFWVDTMDCHFFGMVHIFSQTGPDWTNRSTLWCSDQVDYELFLFIIISLVNQNTETLIGEQ
jgi:hypothetical protein